MTAPGTVTPPEPSRAAPPRRRAVQDADDQRAGGFPRRDPPSDGRSADRRAILERIGRIGRSTPELRFGQLVEFVAFLAECDDGRGIADVEDDAFLVALAQFEADMQRRAAAA